MANEWLQFDDPVTCEITRETAGAFDPNTGQWIPGTIETVTFTAEIRPKAGNRRAREAGTKYESSHWGICDPATDVRPGDTVIAAGVSYEVVHLANWTTHLELDLEAST